MKSFDDGTEPSEDDRSRIDPEELERSLTPPENTVINPDLLDELFETEDPRVQSGIADDDSDDDLDFIRMSGLTSPSASAGIDAIESLPNFEADLTPPVSFYEPGVADVDTAMAPVPPPIEPVAVPELAAALDEVLDDVLPPTDHESDAPDSEEIEPPPIPDEIETMATQSSEVESECPQEDSGAPDSEEIESPPIPDETETMATHSPEVESECPQENSGAADFEPPPAEQAEELAESAIENALPVEVDISDVTTVDVQDDSTEPDTAQEPGLSPEEPALDEACAVDTDVVDLDSLDEDEVFSDLLSVAPVNSGPSPPELPEDELESSDPADDISDLVIEADPVEEVDSEAADDSFDLVSEPSVTNEEGSATPAEDDLGPVVEDLPIDEVELVENAVAQETSVNDDDDDESLVVIEQEMDDKASTEGSIFDDILVDTEHGVPADESVTEQVVATAAATEPATPDPWETPAEDQDRARRSSRHHHRRHQPSYPRLLKAAAVLLVFGGALAYGGYEGYRWFEIRISNPTTLYYEAESTAASGQYLQASRLYEEFVRRNAEHPLAADAMFAAGYQMQQVETENAELARQYSDESLALLGEFVRRHPDHQRAGRAQSLMGIVHYRKADYRAAIDAFIDHGAILRDPAATLPVLRTLARSYAHLGEYEAAHSTYTRAANSPGNPSPDTDYDELGEMYRALSQSAETPKKHLAYQELALENWSHAIRYPGINPTRKNTIRVKVDLFSELGALNGTPPAITVQAPVSDIVVPLEGAAGVSQAAFELTSPLPFGPIIRGVRGNDDPEPVIEQTKASPVDDGPVATEFRVVSDASSEIEETVPSSIPESEPASYHEIAAGEQLLRIAVEHGISTEDLMRWNQIDDANHIEVGQRIILHEPALEHN